MLPLWWVDYLNQSSLVDKTILNYRYFHWQVQNHLLPPYKKFPQAKDYQR